PSDVSPVFPRNDSADPRRRDAEEAAKGALAELALFVEAPDVHYLFFSELRVRVAAPSCGPTLRRHVGAVLRFRSSKQVVGVHTSGIVTPVAAALGFLSRGQEERHAGGQYHSSLPVSGVAELELAMAVLPAGR